MTSHPSLLSYFFNAGLVVQGVMLLLLSASIASWTLIIQRGLRLRQVQQNILQFQEDFWVAMDLTHYYTELGKQTAPMTGLETLFFTGFQEFLRLKKRLGEQHQDIAQGIRRAMRISATRELNRLEDHLPLLASVGSVSPYVGLFGTVWGIMAALQTLGSVQQATISLVAPGISEALVATALGLFAAIPAVLAYNRYTVMLDKIEAEYTLFQEELITLLTQQ